MTAGVLYVVATPIGNLGDISARALRILSEVAAIAAEDTRHSAQLLQYFSIQRPLIALHEHNEAAQVEHLIARLHGGDSLALISDAGTPLISDPGFRLVSAAHAAQLPVRTVPGASAAMAALSVAGQASDRFVFEGFLPAKSAARRARLQELEPERRSLIFYEAPHRLQETLDDMLAVLGRRSITLCRELTKTFETVLRMDLADLCARVREDEDQRRGEIVLVLEGCLQVSTPVAEHHRVLDVLLQDLPVSQAASLAARLTGGRRKWFYEEALARANRT